MTETKKTFMDKPIRTAFSEEHGGWLFSAMDICAVLTDTSRPRGYWNDKKKEIQVSEKIVHLKMLAPSGRMHPTDALNVEGATLLAHSIKSPHAEKFIEWLAHFDEQALSKKFVLKHKDFDVIEMVVDSTGELTSFGEVFSKERLPLGAITKIGIDFKYLREWWKTRAIPASRDGIRNLLEVVGVSFSQQLLEKSLGLSLSDQYWICPVHTKISWSDINFFDNDFSEDVGDILLGRLDWDEMDISEISLVSPDNTSDGILRKKWKIIDGKRCLIKGGGSAFNQEVANEVIASRICKRLGIPFVNYEIIEVDDKKYSVCEDFITRDTELVAAAHIKNLVKKDNNTSDYESIIQKAEELGIAGTRRRIDMMLVLDFIIANIDRHYNNFGFIRDANTLKWISVAPIFDSGTSMWCRESYSKIKPEGPTSSRPFRTKHEEQIKLVKDFSWLDFDALEGIEEECLEILKLSLGDPNELIDRHKIISTALKKRIEFLKTIVEKSKKGGGE